MTKMNEKKSINEIYVKELDKLSDKKLLDKLNDDKDLLKTFKNNLYKYSDFVTYENNYFKFSYVGVILFGDLVIYCYPKYINKKTDEKTLKKKFKQVLKVIMKDYKKKSFSYEYNDSDDVPYNKLPLSLFFLEDYYENGLYSKNQNQLEINGNGEINWDKTINESIPLIDNEDYRPYYTELQTNLKINEVNNYFRLLHECIITDCSKFLEEYGLIDLFDLTPIEITDKTIEGDYGDAESVSNKIDKELNVEFNTRNRNLLKLMHHYISEKNSFTEDNFLTLYGTNKFEHVWEDVCKEVLEDKLEISLNKLGLSNKQDKGNKKIKLKDIIKKPTWYYEEDNDVGHVGQEFEDNVEKKGWIPDIVTFNKDRDYFIILDAKYYKLKFYKDKNNKLILNNSPGVESVSKQYFYELSFKEFYQFNGFKGAKNAFLFPTDKKEFINKGYAELEVLRELKFYDENNHEEQQRLENIQIILLPAEEIYEHYLKGEPLNLSELKLKGVN